MCRCRCLYINVTYQFVYLFHSPYGLFWINCHLDELAFGRNVVWTTLNELSFGRILMDELSLGQIDVEPQEKSLITNAFNFIAELELIDNRIDNNHFTQNTEKHFQETTRNENEENGSFGKQVVAFCVTIQSVRRKLRKNAN